MKAREELVQRVAQRRALEDHLSPNGYQELLLACQKDPQSFVETPEDAAFAKVAQALERNDKARDDESLLDDDEYVKSRTARLARLKSDCEQALQEDPSCIDARLLLILADDGDPDLQVKPLGDLLHEGESRLAEQGQPRTTSGDAWDDVRLRPYLRVRAALCRAYADAARYLSALDEGRELIKLAPSDRLGARHTMALAYARLEDEDGFDRLDQRFSHAGDSWSALARVLLLYKLGRMSAARRALRGYDQLCEGGAYVLLRPILVDTYLPDRPEVKPYSFDEVMLAVHEADPVVVDVPDFIAWTQVQPGFVDSARDFARHNDFDW